MGWGIAICVDFFRFICGGLFVCWWLVGNVCVIFVNWGGEK